MPSKKSFTPGQLRYLQLLAKEYPTVQTATTEIKTIADYITEDCDSHGAAKALERFILN